MPSQRSAKLLSSHEKVMRAATLLFASKGFEGTSTRDIARKAKVNEITIFRLFKSKQDLYLRILDTTMRLAAPEWLHSVFRSSDSPERVFLTLAERLEEIFDPVFLRLLFYAALEKPELLRKRYAAGLLCFYEILGGHLRERIESQTLRNIEPMLMGRALVGMIAYDRIVRELLGGCDDPGCDLENASRVYTDIFLFGASGWRSPGRQRRTELVPAKAVERVSAEAIS